MHCTNIFIRLVIYMMLTANVIRHSDFFRKVRINSVFVLRQKRTKRFLLTKPEIHTTRYQGKTLSISRQDEIFRTKMS